MHPLTTAITSAVTEFSNNHQSLRQLMVNTLVAIVEGKVGPLFRDANDRLGIACQKWKEEVADIKFHGAETATLAELQAERDTVAALRKFKAYVHQRLDDAGVPKFDDGRECRIGERLSWVLLGKALQVAVARGDLGGNEEANREALIDAARQRLKDARHVRTESDLGDDDIAIILGVKL